MAGLFFDIRTDSDQKLMDAYDVAVAIFRTEVGKAMEEAAIENPAFQKEFSTAAEALALRPLPSEANSDPDALRRLALSSLTIEKIFGRLATEGAGEPVAHVAARMREIGKTTTGRTELKPLTNAAITAVGILKGEIVEDMEGLGFDQHIAELQRMTAVRKGKTPPARKGPRL